MKKRKRDGRCVLISLHELGIVTVYGVRKERRLCCRGFCARWAREVGCREKSCT